MQDALRAYLELALGVTEASRKRATKAVEGLVGRGSEFVGKGGATAKQVQAMAGELVATSAANREALAKLVRFEVDRALATVGLATAEEVGVLTSRVRDLERLLDEAQSRLASASAAKRASARAVAASGTRRTTRQSATRPSAAKKAAAKKAAAKKAAPTKTTAKKTAAKKTAATKTAATKTAAKKTAAKNTGARKTAAKRTAPARTGGAKRTSASKATSRAARS
jgi:polyhydroxyalkanoate synthesis regulator phasin